MEPLKPSVSFTPVAVVTGLVAGAALLAASYAVQATNWAVMTDELQTARLAISIGDTLSPVPSIHGEYYGALSQLYPLLISPLYGLLPVPEAFDAAHTLNAVLLASSAWPAFLLARSVTGSRAAGYLGAALTVFTPWLVLSATLLTENAAYPAFVWAVFAAHRTIARPSEARDLAALAGVIVAFFARTQLFVVALALPLAIVGHELAFALAGTRAAPRRAIVRDALVRTAGSHRLLAGAYALGAVAAGILAGAGRLDAVVGTYAETFSAPLLPAGFWEAAAVHLDHVVVAGGVLPFLLAVAWTLVTVARPARKEEHAFALLLIPLFVLLVFEASSFDLRFTPGAFVQDRYLAYLTPLLAVAAASALVHRSHRRAVSGIVAGAALVVGWLAGFASYEGESVIFWAAPAAAFHPALASAGDALSVAPETFVRLGAFTLGVALAAALWRAPARATLWATGAGLGIFGAFEAGYVFDRAAVPATTRPSTIVSERRDWVDAALPGGASVTLVPNPYLGATFWWDAEFWNVRVERILRVDGSPTFSPFPAEELSLDFETGALIAQPRSDVLLVAISETRFGLAETATVAQVPPLRLVRVARPFRVAWATRGAERDGWTRPGRPVTLRLYPYGKPGRREVVATLSAPREATAPLGFTLRGDSLQTGSVPPGRFTRVRFAVCVAEDAVEAILVPSGSTPLPDGRVVSVHLDRLEASPTGRC